MTADPRDVRIAHVVKAGTPAATLTRADGEVEFSYLPEYLESGARAVATTLPLTEQPVRTSAGAVPAFFSGLLPEGRRLTALRRSVKTSADDELSLLVAIGSDPVGDVQVLADLDDQDETRTVGSPVRSAISTSVSCSRRTASGTRPRFLGSRTRSRAEC